MRRRHLFKRNMTPPPIRNVFMITFIVFVICMFLSIIMINNAIKPIMMDIAEQRTIQIANLAMGIAVNKRLNEDLRLEDLVIKDTDAEGNIVSWQINTALENRVQRNVQYRVQNFLQLLEKGEVPQSGETLDVELEPEEEDTLQSLRDNPTVIDEIPLGEVLGLPLLSNLGPKIPVNIQLIGYVNSEVQTSVKELTINNIYVESVVHIDVEIKTIIPFASKPVLVTQDIPIVQSGVMGDVPLYYNNGGNNDLSLPMSP